MLGTDVRFYDENALYNETAVTPVTGVTYVFDKLPPYCGLLRYIFEAEAFRSKRIHSAVLL
jgi:hypothetical protein